MRHAFAAAYAYAMPAAYFRAAAIDYHITLLKSAFHFVDCIDIIRIFSHC
jgi:hypothetical protein